MNERDFCYWLQGFFELDDSISLSPTQIQIIKDHLALVFNKVTPDRTPQIDMGQLADAIYNAPIKTDMSWLKGKEERQTINFGDNPFLLMRTGVSC